MRPAWVRAVRDQCAELGVSFFLEQVCNNHTDWPGITSKGTDLTEWPLDLRIQEYPIQ
jgi:protein gp37